MMMRAVAAGEKSRLCMNRCALPQKITGKKAQIGKKGKRYHRGGFPYPAKITGKSSANRNEGQLVPRVAIAISDNNQEGDHGGTPPSKNSRAGGTLMNHQAWNGEEC